MPTRLLREDILTSERINDLTWAEEVFYRRLMSVVDDFGRFDGRAEIVRARLYPFKLGKVTVADVQSWIAKCVKAGLVSGYTVEAKPYLELLRFRQQVRAKTSKYPANPNPHESICAHVRADAHLGACVDEGAGAISADEPQEPAGFVLQPEPEPPKRKVREPCPIWDTVAELWFAGNVAKPHATRVGKVVRDLKDLAATPDEIRRRRKALAHKWPNVDVTPESLVKHWVQVGGKLAPTGPTLAELQAEAARKLANKPSPTLTPEQKRAIMQQVKQTKGNTNDVPAREDDRPGDEPTAGETDQQRSGHDHGAVCADLGPVAGPDE